MAESVSLGQTNAAIGPSANQFEITLKMLVDSVFKYMFLTSNEDEWRLKTLNYLWARYSICLRDCM